LFGTAKDIAKETFMAERYIRKSWRWLTVLGLFLVAATTTLADNEASLARMKKDIFFLASPECEGRGVDTKGINKAADYIAAEFKKAGLLPGGINGYEQPFSFNDGFTVRESALVLTGPKDQKIELTPSQDYNVPALSVSGEAASPLVFAGYGVTLPDGSYDDYKDLDVAGKIVVVLRRVPRWDNAHAPFGGDQNKYAGFVNKIALAKKHKAAAILFVNDFSEAADDRFSNFTGSPTTLPVLQLRRSILDMMLMAGWGKSLRDVEKDIDSELKPRSGPITGWTAKVQVTMKPLNFACKNIIGVLPGAGPLKDEIVVVGAHYDHWGYGGYGSLAKDQTIKQLHPGADDNGSGTTAVMELARRFGAMKDRKGRTLVFMCFSGEERGLYGSKYYCNKDPLFPLDKTVAMVNLDMVGRLTDNKLKAEGVGTAKGFEALVDNLNADFGFKLQKSKSGRGPSDHDSFCAKKIPVLFFWTGIHSDYHKPTDTADRINVAGMEKVASFAEKCLMELTTQAERPEYVQVADGGGAVGPVNIPRLQVGFDYGDSSNKGTLIDSTREDGVGAKAGLKAGDRITAINGAATPNFATYMEVMGKHQPGVPLELTINRGGKEMKLKVTPQ
jgi:hypothetical protein